VLTPWVMKLSKSAFVGPSETRHEDQAERELALEHLAAAWNDAEDEGIATEALAHAALFAALATFVSEHGEEGAARLVEALPSRVRDGDYSLERTLQ
jgi:hypothetical protein